MRLNMQQYCVECQKIYETKNKKCPVCREDLIEIQDVKEKEEEQDEKIIRQNQSQRKK